MCKSSIDGGKRCSPSPKSRQKSNALKRARYAEKKENENVGRHSDQGRTNGIPEASGLGEFDQGRAEGNGSQVDGRQDQNGNRSAARLNVGGQKLNVVGIYGAPEERKKELMALGKSSPRLREIEAQEHAGFFRDTIGELKESKWHASVYIYSEEEYKNMRLFLTEDGTAGIAIKADGDIVSVFAKSNSPHKAVANSMISTAVSLGGNKLDCFDTVLPTIYEQEGFVETKRFEWNDEYKPDGWDYDTYKGFNNGRPDVVMMEYAGNNNH